MGDRRIYISDVVTALLGTNLHSKFEAWADIYYPDIPSYFEVIARIAQDRGVENLYNDIRSGKFEEEMTLAPVHQV